MNRDDQKILPTPLFINKDVIHCLDTVISVMKWFILIAQLQGFGDSHSAMMEFNGANSDVNCVYNVYIFITVEIINCPLWD